MPAHFGFLDVINIQIFLGEPLALIQHCLEGVCTPVNQGLIVCRQHAGHINVAESWRAAIGLSNASQSLWQVVHVHIEQVWAQYVALRDAYLNQNRFTNSIDSLDHDGTVVK